MAVPKIYLRVAVPSPLRRSFDYLPPAGCDLHTLQPGMRLRVPFGRSTLVAVLLAISDETDVPQSRLKRVSEVLDSGPLLSRSLLKLLLWASSYYQYPIGEVLGNALPVLLRQGQLPAVQGEQVWRLTPTAQELDAETVAQLERRAPRQAALLALLQAAGDDGLTATPIDAVQEHWRPVMRKLVDKGWVAVTTRVNLLVSAGGVSDAAPSLHPEQAAAVEAMGAGLGRFGVHLLEGVTGSGKTEVYLALMERVLSQGRQVLVLVPEIGLTPQLVSRFQRRLNAPMVVLHSGLSNRERLSAWLAARSGEAALVIGTRSAVFTPFNNLGLVILDEEHDASFKQQEGFRYSARDVAVKRAQLEDLPVVLGSATPSLESLYNAQQGRYARLALTRRAGVAQAPSIAVLDVRKQPMFDGLSTALLNAMRRHLESNGQVLVFLNRRGYAPTLLCHDCGWVATCRRCDAHMTLFNHRTRLRCHHCGAERPVEPQCPECESTELRPVGAGTERLEAALQHQFPDTGIVRIDRDTTRRKGAMATLLDSVHDGSKRILVGTQMLAKGHHFPDVTLVGIVDMDQGLFSADFRATERMAQLLVQVAGRAGRAERPGQVLIQTHHPDHPLLQTLLREGYAAFARAALEERRQARLAPYSHLALLRAEAVDGRLPLQFLQHARSLAEQSAMAGVQLLGPVPAPMERRAGRVRAQLLLQADERADLHRLLETWLQQLEADKLARKVRWSIDVDPQEMF
ncbi:MAG TPA: primosomal protein N' [Gammaproteobacteria bacterium]|nr:primosomal protein N' [Gammaproteobacteria bacterium]